MTLITVFDTVVYGQKFKAFSLIDAKDVKIVKMVQSLAAVCFHTPPPENWQENYREYSRVTYHSSIKRLAKAIKQEGLELDEYTMGVNSENVVVCLLGHKCGNNRDDDSDLEFESEFESE